MRAARILGLWIAGGLAWAAPAPAHASDGCLSCHGQMADAPSQQFAHDIHHRAGITCAGCHGGDPSTDDMDRAMSKDAGFIGVPKGDAISAMCAHCHASADTMRTYGSTSPADEYAKLTASVHGRVALSGSQRIVQCTTCHNAHGIVKVSDPASPVYPLNIVKTCARCHSNAVYMRGYNPALPVDQLEKYRTSVHGMRNARGDAKAAECVSCHGSHDIQPRGDPRSHVNAANVPATCAVCHNNPEYMKGYGIPTDQYSKYVKSVHGVALLQKHEAGAPACNDCHGNHGAVPPGLESISQVCGTCHALNAELFAKSPHKQAFDRRNLPECGTCHGYHDVVPATTAMLGVADGAVCGRCHGPNENPRGYEAALDMRRLADSLDTMEDEAKTLVAEAEQKGMEVSDETFRLRDVHQQRLELRTLVHAFDDGRYREAAAKALTVALQVRDASQGALREYLFRRVGLGVATLIITILAISLYLFIRRLERPGAEQTGDRSAGATMTHHTTR